MGRDAAGVKVLAGPKELVEHVAVRKDFWSVANLSKTSTGGMMLGSSCCFIHSRLHSGPF